MFISKSTGDFIAFSNAVFVISVNNIRFRFSFGTFNCSDTCQAIASPSLSKSQPNNIFLQRL